MSLYDEIFYFISQINMQIADTANENIVWDLFTINLENTSSLTLFHEKL